jgi:hypothetical protein
MENQELIPFEISSIKPTLGAKRISYKDFDGSVKSEVIDNKYIWKGKALELCKKIFFHQDFVYLT